MVEARVEFLALSGDGASPGGPLGPSVFGPVFVRYLSAKASFSRGICGPDELRWFCAEDLSGCANPRKLYQV